MGGKDKSSIFNKWKGIILTAWQSTNNISSKIFYDFFLTAPISLFPCNIESIEKMSFKILFLTSCSRSAASVTLLSK